MDTDLAEIVMKPIMVNISESTSFPHAFFLCFLSVSHACIFATVFSHIYFSILKKMDLIQLVLD